VFLRDFLRVFLRVFFLGVVFRFAI
jgi:hypothetical protein